MNCWQAVSIVILYLSSCNYVQLCCHALATYSEMHNESKQNASKGLWNSVQRLGMFGWKCLGRQLLHVEVGLPLSLKDIGRSNRYPHWATDLISCISQLRMGNMTSASNTKDAHKAAPCLEIGSPNENSPFLCSAPQLFTRAAYSLLQVQEKMATQAQLKPSWKQICSPLWHQ